MKMIKGLMAMAGVMGALTVGCGTESETSPTPTASGTPTATPDTTVAVTFKVDTSTMADGVNHLAEVAEGEQVFLVGDMMPGGMNCWAEGAPVVYPCWDPQASAMAMTDEGNGIFSITLDLDVGVTVEYKYAKTKSAGSEDGWSNGIKDWEAVATRVCTSEDPLEVAASEVSGGALWEIGANLTYTVAAGGGTVPTTTVDAWRDTAEAFGYPSCD